MKIEINGKTVEIFGGGRVRDALRKYSAELLTQIENKKKKVVDGHGNPVALDGELSEGQQLHIA